MRLERKIGLWKIARKAERHKFMYKVVDRKNKSAGIDCICGREVYASRVTWSCNKGIQKHVVRYEMTQIRTGTRGIKIGQWEKSLSKLISPKITKTTHRNKSLDFVFLSYLPG